VSATGIAATAQRLELRAKALAHVLDARLHDQHASAHASHAEAGAAYRNLRMRRRLSSFDCVIFDQFSQACAARAAAFEASALRTQAEAERASAERRHWGALSRGLQRRRRRSLQARPWRD
jgi:hypothetical protein